MALAYNPKIPYSWHNFSTHNPNNYWGIHWAVSYWSGLFQIATPWCSFGFTYFMPSVDYFNHLESSVWIAHGRKKNLKEGDVLNKHMEYFRKIHQEEVCQQPN